MLAAEKQALEASLKQWSLQIREKELSFFNNSLASIATTCALLAGFSYANMQVDFEGVEGIGASFLKAVYLLMATLSMGLNLLTVCNATFTIIFGTGLALRGPDGSMHRAVDGMSVERKVAVRSFFGGIISFMLSAVTFAMLRFHWPEATIVTCTLAMFIAGFLFYARRIRGKFVIPSDMVIRGEVNLGGFRPEVASANVCKGCGSPLLPGNRFCARCGSEASGAKAPSLAAAGLQATSLTPVRPAGAGARTCGTCGAAASPVARCCAHCGTVIGAPAAAGLTPAQSSEASPRARSEASYPDVSFRGRSAARAGPSDS